MADEVIVRYLSAQTRYLATQTEQNTAAVQASVRQAILYRENRESLYKIIEYPFLGRACNLTEEQKTQTRAYLAAFLRMRENYWSSPSEWRPRSGHLGVIQRATELRGPRLRVRTQSVARRIC